MESDVNPADKALEAVRKIKQNKLKLSAEVEAALHNVPDLNSDNEAETGNIEANFNQKSSKNKTPTNSTRKCYQGKEFTKTPAVLKINTRTQYSSQLKNMFVDGKSGAAITSVKNKNVRTSLTTDLEEKWDDSDESLLDIEPMEKVHETGSKLLYENIYSDSDEDKLSISQKKHIRCQPAKTQICAQSFGNKSKEKLGKKPEKTNDSKRDPYLKQKKPHGPKKDRRTSDSELLWEIYHDLQKVKVDLDEIKANQRLEQEARHNTLIEQGIRNNFITKYNLDLPFCTKAEFDEFCENLLTNDDYQKEFADKEKKKKTKKKEEAPAAEPAAAKAAEPEPSPAPEPEPAAKSPAESNRASRGSKRAKRSGSNVFSMFSQKQVAEFKEGFSMMDHDKDGIITKKDLRFTFDQVGRLVNEKELDEMIGEASGPINFTQLLNLFATRMSGSGGADDDEVVIQAFKSFDDGNGKIDGERLKKALMTFGDKFTQKEINDAYDLMYIDDKGKIDTESLINMLLGTGEDEEES